MRGFFACLFAIVLAGCASSETNSIVSSSSIPAGRYHKIIILVENLNDSDRDAMEQMLASRLHAAGVEFSAGSALLGLGTETLTPDQKGELIRSRGFDAALFVRVVEKDVVNEPAPGWTFDGRMFNSPPGMFQYSVGAGLPNPFVVDQYGQVVKPILTFATESELQDTHTGVRVWAANSSATVNGKFGTMSSLAEKVASDIVSKLRSDKALQ